MPKKQNGWIQYNDETKKPFKASSPANALVVAQDILKVRSLTRKIIDKAGVRSIHFGDGDNSHVIYPIKHKRTLDKRHDRHCMRNHPACACKHQNDIGQRRHRGSPRRQQLAA